MHQPVSRICKTTLFRSFVSSELRNSVGHVIQRMVPCLLFPPRLFLRVNPLPIGGSRVGTGDRCCGLRPRLPGMPRVEEAGRGVLGGNAQQGRPALHVRPYNVRPLYETLIIYIYSYTSLLKWVKLCYIKLILG